MKAYFHLMNSQNAKKNSTPIAKKGNAKLARAIVGCSAGGMMQLQPLIRKPKQHKMFRMIKGHDNIFFSMCWWLGVKGIGRKNVNNVGDVNYDLS